MIYLLFISGLIISSLSVLLGIGGGVFTVPLLFYTGHSVNFPANHIAQMAIASSLFFAFTLSISGTIVNLRHGRVRIKDGLILMVGNIPGALIGSKIADYIHSGYLALIFAIFISSVGIHSLTSTILQKIRNNNSSLQNDNNQDIEKKHESHPLSRFPLSLFPGLVVGLISSLTGVGGGVLMVPIFHTIFRHDFRTAISTSSFGIIFTAFSGAVGYGIMPIFSGNIHKLPEPSIGYLYIPFLIGLIPGGIIGGMIGSIIGKKIRSSVIKNVFSILQIVIGIKMLIDIASNI